jgi:hypothetical protein
VPYYLHTNPFCHFRKIIILLLDVRSKVSDTSPQQPYSYSLLISLEGRLWMKLDKALRLLTLCMRGSSVVFSSMAPTNLIELLWFSSVQPCEYVKITHACFLHRRNTSTGISGLRSSEYEDECGMLTTCCLVEIDQRVWRAYCLFRQGLGLLMTLIIETANTSEESTSFYQTTPHPWR